MKRFVISTAMVICFIFCLPIVTALAEGDPIISGSYEEWIPAPDYGTTYQGYDNSPSKPRPENYQKYLENADPDAPDFERYGLDRHTVDFLTVSGEGWNRRYITTGFHYTTGGYDGERTTQEYTANATVFGRWLRFYDETAEDKEADARKHRQYCAHTPVSLFLVPVSEDVLEVITEIEEAEGNGYEWRSLDLEINFSDWDNGYKVGTDISDYYNIDGTDASVELITDENGVRYSKVVSNYAGNENTYYWFVTSERNEEGEIKIQYFCYVPKGYDGCVFTLFDTRLAPDGYEEGKHIYDYMNENMLCFRLK